MPCHPPSAGTRPSTWPCGHQLRRKNMKIDRATAIKIPCSTPSRITDSVATTEIRSAVLRTRQNVRKSPEVEQGQARRRSRRRRARAAAGPAAATGRNSSSTATMPGADQTRHLRLRAGLLGDGGSRAARGDREPLEQPGGGVGRAHPDHLLVGVDLVAAPGREAGRRRDRVRERHEHDAERRDQQRSESLSGTDGMVGPGAPGAARPRSRRRRRRDRARAVTRVAPTTATSTAGTFVVTRGRTSSTASVARPTARAVMFVWSRPVTNAFASCDEAVGIGGEPEELRQLADDDRDREAVHVADLHLLGEQVGDEPELGEPEPDLDRADDQRHHARQRDRGRRIADARATARSPRRSAARPTSPARARGSARARRRRSRRGRRWSCTAP